MAAAASAATASATADDDKNEAINECFMGRRRLCKKRSSSRRGSELCRWAAAELFQFFGAHT